MAEIFENFDEEINNLISLSAKNNTYSLFSIQNGKRIDLVFFNNTLERCNFDILQQVSLTLISKEGFIIEGCSDKLYLSDVISRLYSSLESLLKPNENHNVKKSVEIDSLSPLPEAAISYSDFEDWDLEYLKSLCEEIYSNLDQSTKEKFHIKLNLVSSYSLLRSGSTDKAPYYHDSFELELKCSIYSRENDEDMHKFTVNIPYANILNKDYDSSSVINEIQKVNF